MKLRLVGTNVELAAVEEALSGEVEEGLLSPEPIAAAYARISRSQHSVEELRRRARRNVAKARRSNETIVFEMGHSSIAEHAVFNFDLEGISRLAIEAIQHSRLASYTERSQRYVLIGKDYVVPGELKQSADLETLCEKTVATLFDAYRVLHQRLVTWLGREHPEVERDSARWRDLETRAKEDARYVLPLAATGQLGMTLNARSLGLMVRRLKASPLAELRQVGEELETCALRVTPSLIRHTDPTPLDRDWPPAQGQVRGEEASAGQRAGLVRLVHCTPDGDALLHSALSAVSGAGPIEWPAAVERPEPGGPFHEYYAQATAHTAAPRVFELVDLTFEVVCSASCFGQLKRHRLATILPGPYAPVLGVCVPPLVAEASCEGEFLQACADADRAYEVLAARDAEAAAYLLTNGHCRRVLVKMNLRELYHFTRLRMDGHAQWEIRAMAGRMAALAREQLPVAAHWLGGKDAFSD